MDTPKDAYEEAIEKIADKAKTYVGTGDLLAGPLNYSGEQRIKLMARHMAEAIGLREMMEDAEVGRELRENPKAFIAYRPVRKTGV